MFKKVSCRKISVFCLN